MDALPGGSTEMVRKSDEGRASEPIATESQSACQESVEVPAGLKEST